MLCFSCFIKLTKSIYSKQSWNFTVKIFFINSPSPSIILEEKKNWSNQFTMVEFCWLLCKLENQFEKQICTSDAKNVTLSFSYLFAQYTWVKIYKVGKLKILLLKLKIKNPDEIELKMKKMKLKIQNCSIDVTSAKYI